jgi:Tol biopolymer transport system component
MTAYTAALSDDAGVQQDFGFQIHPVPVDFYSLLKTNGEILDPSWSPDGDKIIFAERQRATYSIRTLLVDATPIMETLYTDLYPIGEPRYSPDSFFILFSEQTVLPSEDYPYGQSRIRFMNADGSNVQTIIDDGAANLRPCWSTPNQVAYQYWQYDATPSSEFRIALIDVSGNDRIDMGPGEYPRVVEV